MRRITAVTSQEAWQYYEQQVAILNSVQDQLKVAQVKEIPNKVEQLNAELKATQKQLENLQTQLVQKQASGILDQVEQIGSWQLTAAITPDRKSVV